jgi:hypothetical protein
MPKRIEAEPFPKHRRTRKGLMPILRNYWVEITAGIAILVGILVMAVEFQRILDLFKSLQESIQEALQEPVTVAANATSTAQDTVAASLSLPDMIGMSIVVVGLGVIFWRSRVRVDKSPTRRLYSCPRCDGELRRIHRSLLDRLFTTLFFPHGRRYQCCDNECAWTGILHQGVHNRMHETGRSSPS